MSGRTLPWDALSSAWKAGSACPHESNNCHANGKEVGIEKSIKVDDPLTPPGPHCTQGDSCCGSGHRSKQERRNSRSMSMRKRTGKDQQADATGNRTEQRVAKHQAPSAARLRMANLASRDVNPHLCEHFESDLENGFAKYLEEQFEQCLHKSGRSLEHAGANPIERCGRIGAHGVPEANATRAWAALTAATACSTSAIGASEDA